jgi:predicted nucleic acid-binding protein
VIFVDSNIPMYLVGAEHPNKNRARELLDAAISRGDRLMTDAEVLQEILHRYSAIGRREAIQPALDVLLAVVDEVAAIEERTVLRARDLMQDLPELSARDAVHLAAMEAAEATTIMTFDTGFDARAGITRLA